MQWLSRSLHTREIPSSILGIVILLPFVLILISGLFLLWICTNPLGYVFSTRNHLLVLFLEVSHADPCKYSDISLPSSNVDQVVVRTNGKLFAVPVAGPTGQLYIRPVKGTERYTHKSVKLNCHKYLRHWRLRTRHAISSFAWDPFSTSMLVTGAEDGEILVCYVFSSSTLAVENPCRGSVNR